MNSDMNSDLDEVDRELFQDLRDHYVTLKAKFGRRKRSPLKFVQAYDAFSRELQASDNWSWPATDPIRIEMKKFMFIFKGEYDRCVPLAELQAKRNELWDEMYRPIPGFLPGGRADGNSR
jgi:hypothetical protein